MPGCVGRVAHPHGLRFLRECCHRSVSARLPIATECSRLRAGLVRSHPTRPSVVHQTNHLPPCGCTYNARSADGRSQWVIHRSVESKAGAPDQGSGLTPDLHDGQGQPTGDGGRPDRTAGVDRRQRHHPRPPRLGSSSRSSPAWSCTLESACGLIRAEVDNHRQIHKGASIIEGSVEANERSS